MTPTTAQHLAESVVADGFATHAATLGTFLEAARRRGANPVLVAIAGDAGEPEVARLRALGRLVVELSSSAYRSDAPAVPTRRVVCGTSAA